MDEPLTLDQRSRDWGISATWVWARSSSDRRYYVGKHLESRGAYKMVTDDFGRLVLV